MVVVKLLFSSTTCAGLKDVGVPEPPASTGSPGRWHGSGGHENITGHLSRDEGGRLRGTARHQCEMSLCQFQTVWGLDVD